jgi:hypothetical protein
MNNSAMNDDDRHGDDSLNALISKEPFDISEIFFF